MEREAKLLIVEYDDWTGLFTSALATGYATTTTLESQFLQGKEEGLDATGTAAEVETLSLDLYGGDDADGVAFFTTQATNRYNFAGVFSGTNLGAPIARPTDTNASLTTTWRGWITAVGDVTLDQEFELMVKFNRSRGGGTLSASFQPDETGRLFKIDAGFNNNGTIDNAGSAGIIFGLDGAEDADKYQGNLRGLIGLGGAVAVFLADSVADDDNKGFSGGFVARPVADITAWEIEQTSQQEKNAEIARQLGIVNYADWVTVAGNPLPATPTAGSTQFVAGTPTGVVITGVSVPWGTKTPQIDTLTLANFGGDTKNGVGFFTGIHKDTPNEWHGYAGIFSGTDLGAPITQGEGPRTLIWKGLFAARGDVAFTHEFDLKVKFDTGGGGGTVSTFFKPDPAFDNYFKIYTRFDTKGIINGTRDNGVTFGKFRNNNANHLLDGDTGRYYGTLTGLIGEHGAVGAFVASATAVGDIREFRGGFVARNPADIPIPPPRANYDTWVNGAFIDGLGAAADCPQISKSQFVRVRSDNKLNICGLGALNSGLEVLPTTLLDGEDKLYQREFVKTASSLLGPTRIVGGFTHNHVLWASTSGRRFSTVTNRKRESGEHNAQQTFQGSLHDSTDVGLLLPAGRFENNATAYWKGYLAAEGTSKTLETWSVNTAIVPQIDFVKRTITISQAGGTGNGNERLTFNNMIFNEHGFITGYVDAPHNVKFGTAPIRGVIGQNGLVAVFVQYWERYHGYAGGLVACPTANVNGTGACK